MKCTETKLKDAIIIEPAVFSDSRGYFLETWHKKKFEEAGLPHEFKQDNVSFSQKNILRGLHFQNPNSQGKLVTVFRGAVFDVAVDLRLSSPTFGKWDGVILSEENHKFFYIPEGFAHGFLTLSDNVLFSYKCTQNYSPSDEHTLMWNDEELNIDWPTQNVMLSEKDLTGKRLKDFPRNLLFK